MTEYMKNPLTGYRIKVGGKRYKTLIIEGVIPHPKYGTTDSAKKEPPLENIPEQHTESEEEEEEEQKPLKLTRVNTKKPAKRKPAKRKPRVRKQLMEKVVPDVIERGKRDIPADLSDEQVDRLLKKMLYEKLVVKPRDGGKTKKKSRRKTRKVYTPPSSDSESSSESE